MTLKELMQKEATTKYPKAVYDMADTILKKNDKVTEGEGNTPSQLSKEQLEKILGQEMTTTDAEGNVTGKLSVEDQQNTDFTEEDVKKRIQVNNMLEDIFKEKNPVAKSQEELKKEGAFSPMDLVHASFYDEVDKLAATLKITQRAAKFLRGLAGKAKNVAKKVDKAADKVDDVKIVVKKPVKITKRQGRPYKKSVSTKVKETVDKVKDTVSTAVDRSKKSVKSLAKRVKFQKPIAVEKSTKKVTKEVKKVVKKTKPKAKPAPKVAPKAKTKAKAAPPAKKPKAKTKPRVVAPPKSKKSAPPAKKTPPTKGKSAPPAKKGKVIRIKKTKTTKTKSREVITTKKKKNMAVPIAIAGAGGVGAGVGYAAAGKGQTKAAAIMEKLALDISKMMDDVRANTSSSTPKVTDKPKLKLDSKDDSHWTPEGGYSKKGLEIDLGLDPGSVAVDTLSYRNPGNFNFNIAGTKDGKPVKDIKMNVQSIGTNPRESQKDDEKRDADREATKNMTAEEKAAYMLKQLDSMFDK